MGTFTEYFAATRDEALACAADGPGNTELPQIDLKWIDPAVMLGQLWAHAEGQPYSQDYWGDDGPPLAGDGQGPWVVQIKDACTASLAAIADDRLLPIAEGWRLAEEWIGDWEPDELAEVVGGLRTVAQAAQSTDDTHMYVWICL